MHPLTTIHKLNREAEEADWIIRRHRYLENLTEAQREAFNQLAPDMQQYLVNQIIIDRRQTLTTR